MAFNLGSSCVTSCTLDPVTTSDKGTPRPSTSRWRLLPFFFPIRRVASHRLLGQGRLEHRPVNALPSPGDALQLVVLGKTGLPQCLEEPGLGPLRELLMHRAGAAEAFAGQCLPLAARLQHIHDGLDNQSGGLGGTTRPSTTPILLIRIARRLRYQRLYTFQNSSVTAHESACALAILCSFVDHIRLGKMV